MTTLPKYQRGYKRFPTYEEMREAQEQTDYTLDRQRHAPDALPLTPVALAARWAAHMVKDAGAQPWTPRGFYAIFTQRAGIALRDVQGACWFRAADDGAITLLHNEDISSLQLLGQIDLADEQWTWDLAHGDLAALAAHQYQAQPAKGEAA